MPRRCICRVRGGDISARVWRFIASFDIFVPVSVCVSVIFGGLLLVIIIALVLLIYIVNILVICVITVLAIIIVIAIAIAVIIMVIIIAINVRRSALPDIIQTYGHYALSAVSNGFTETVDSSLDIVTRKPSLKLLVLLT